MNLVESRSSRVGIRADRSVAADQSAEIAPLEVAILFRRLFELSCAEELVVERQMGPAVRPLLGPRHMLPAAVREEPVVAARDQRRAVDERDAICALGGRPVIA